MKFTRTVSTERTVHIEFDADDVRDAIRAYIKADEAVPDNAEVFVYVPGGGDYSHTFLHIEDAPLKVKWTEREESVG